VAGRRSRKAGAGVFIASVILIHLRGYLVPGTPTLTKRYLPDDVLQLFGKEPARPAQSGLGAGFDSDGTAPNGAGDGCAGDGRVAPATTNGGETAESATNSGAVDAARDEAGALDPEVILSNAGALEQCEDGEDLCLSEAFKRAWTTRWPTSTGRRRRTWPSELVAPVRSDVDECEIETFDDGRVLTDGDGRIGQWPSEAAMIADAAGAAVLRSRLSDWGPSRPARRGAC